jgi:hypothetical protein
MDKISNFTFFRLFADKHIVFIFSSKVEIGEEGIEPPTLTL